MWYLHTPREVQGRKANQGPFQALRRFKVAKGVQRTDRCTDKVSKVSLDAQSDFSSWAN